MQLYEKYRPSTLDDVVGQDKAVSIVKRLESHGGLCGRALWISGRTGTGKTTLARIIADAVADPFFVEELDAESLTPAKLQAIEQTCGLYAWGKGGRAYIANEAHGLKQQAMRQLLTTLERIAPHVLWVFTTTRDGQDSLFEDQRGRAMDAHPLLSRCVQISLSTQGLAEPFAKLAREIADKEGLNGKPLSAYVQLVKRCRNNMREVLQEIGAGAMLGE